MPITLETKCCVVGGGPAGMMLGYLLARSGVPVTVIEKHGDFFRDFRGDTVHPSTLGLMYELGLLEDFLKTPHQQLTAVGGVLGDFAFQAADFSHVPAHCKFVALMPQWDFLNFLSARAKDFPAFDLRMRYEAVDLIRDHGRIVGVEARTPEGAVQIRADLVVGCDGRLAVTRKAAQLDLIELGVPIDVLWFRISRKSNDPDQVFGNINYGKGLILVNRGDYFQAGLIIRKGSFEEIKRDGLDALRKVIRQIAPYLGDRVGELAAWEQIKLLSVQINRLRRWSPGSSVHRRCGACHVAGGRGGHQPRDSGCGGDGQFAGRPDARRTSQRSAAGMRATAAGVSYACDTIRAGECAQGVRVRFSTPGAAHSALAIQGCDAHPWSAAPRRPDGRDGRSSGAC
jgi:2-polyprenyl-6-methoxyphenol hydroxylase-like FAD-dependent oxidoreductase